MADNITLNTNATSGAVVKTDDDGTAHWQYVKVAYGADNTQTLVTAANGLTVQPDSGGFAVSATLDAETTKVIGTVNISAAQTIAAVTDITNTVTVEGTGTFAVQADLGANNDVQGMVAEGAAVTGTSPFLIAGDDGTNVKNIAVDASGNVQVDIVADASGTLATAANQTTIIGHVDGIEGLLTTIDADTGTLAGAVTGGQLQVDIAADSTAGLATSALQTTGNTNTTDIPNVIGTTGVAGPTKAFSVGGTEAGGTFRELAVDASGNLQVDIVADGAGLATAANQTTGNTSLGNIETAVQLIDNSIKADDAAFTLASDSVNMAGAVRDDTLSALTAIEGDAVPLRVNSTGALHVTGAGGGTQYTVDDPNPTTVTMAGVVRDDSLTTLTEADGDASVLRVSSTGALHVTGGGGGTEYTEDVATPNPIVGTSTVMERDDALSVLTPIEGDWAAMRCSAEGALWTQDFNSDGILADTNTIAAAVATEGSALGSGVLLQGDDGTDRTNVLVDTDGHLQVDVLSGGGGGTQYAQDTALGGAGTGTLAMATVDATLSAITPVDGDADTVRINANGALWIKHDGNITADLGATDNAVLDTIETNTDFGTVTGGGAEATALRVTLANDSTGVISIDDGGNTITVDGTVTANAGSGTMSVDLGANNDVQGMVAEGAAVTGTQPFLMAGDDGTNVKHIAVDASGNVQTDVVGALPAGDNNIGNVDIVTLPASTNTIEVVGDAAHDAAVAGNPLLMGLESRTTEPTAVGDGDAVRAMATSLGKQVTYSYALPAKTWSYASTAAVTDTADDVAKAAGGAGVRNYVTGIQVFNGSDSTGTEVVIKDGSTVIWRGWAEETGGGCSARFDPPLRGTANTAINVANITTSSSTYFNLQGFQSAE